MARGFMNKKISLKVNGIHCNGCANKIKNSIELLGANSTVNVEIESGKVSVEFNSAKANVGDIKNKITDVGFQVESVEIE